MTLFLVSPFENHLEARGTRNLHIASSYSQNDKCEFITSNFSHGHKRKFKNEEFTSDNRFSYKVLKVPGYQNNVSLSRMVTHWIFCVKLFLYLVIKARNGDKVFISSIPPELVLVAVIVNLFRGTKIYLDVRDLWPDAFEGTGKLPSVLKLYFNLFKLLFYRFDCIFYAIPSFDKKLSKFTQNNLVFVPLGFDANRWKIRHVARTHYKKRKIVYIGYLSNIIDLSNVILVVDNSSKTDLHIIGNGTSYFDLRTEYGHKPSISFHGYLSPVMASQELAKMDFGVIPYFGQAALPNKFFDYLGSGLPIISFGKSDITKMILDHDIGYVFKNESDPNFLEFIAGVDNELDYSQLRSNVIKLRDQYSKDVLYKKIMEVMNND